MQSVQWSLAESESPQLQTTGAAYQDRAVSGKQTPSGKEQSDRQSSAEAMYAAFVWLFGPGCI